MNQEISGLGSTRPGRFTGKLGAIQCILYNAWSNQPKFEVARAEIPIVDGMAMNSWESWYPTAYIELGSPYLIEETVRGGWQIKATTGERRQKYTKKPHRLWVFLQAKADPDKKALVEVQFYTTEYATRWYQRKKEEKLIESQVEQIARRNEEGG
jgi:hypothetical protein